MFIYNRTRRSYTVYTRTRPAFGHSYTLCDTACIVILTYIRKYVNTHIPKAEISPFCTTISLFRKPKRQYLKGKPAVFSHLYALLQIIYRLSVFYTLLFRRKTAKTARHILTSEGALPQNTAARRGAAIQAPAKEYNKAWSELWLTLQSR